MPKYKKNNFFIRCILLSFIFIGFSCSVKSTQSLRKTNLQPAPENTNDAKAGDSTIPQTEGKKTDENQESGSSKKSDDSNGILTKQSNTDLKNDDSDPLATEHSCQPTNECEDKSLENQKKKEINKTLCSTKGCLISDSGGTCAILKGGTGQLICPGYHKNKISGHESAYSITVQGSGVSHNDICTQHIEPPKVRCKSYTLFQLQSAESDKLNNAMLVLEQNEILLTAERKILLLTNKGFIFGNMATSNFDFLNDQTKDLQKITFAQLNDRTGACGLKTNGEIFCNFNKPKFGQTPEVQKTFTIPNSSITLMSQESILDLYGAGTGNEFCALTSKKRVFCFWFNYSKKELGHAFLDDSGLGSNEYFLTMSVGGAHICGLTNQNKTYCSGLKIFDDILNLDSIQNTTQNIEIQNRTNANLYKAMFATGILGRQNPDSESFQFKEIADTNFQPSEQLDQLSCGFTHCCGLSTKNRMMCWGRLESFSDFLIPEEVPLPSN